MYVPVAALAFVPSPVTSKIHELVLTVDEGNTYHRIKQAIDISPEKSVTLRTTEGDTISWDAAEDGRSTKIQLANGLSWSKFSLCSECTATSVVADDSVTDALDEFVASVGVEDDEGGRRLFAKGCHNFDLRMCLENNKCLTVFFFLRSEKAT